jgi:NADH pyrophosphatase NudC (nudix superfamily)
MEPSQAYTYCRFCGGTLSYNPEGNIGTCQSCDKLNFINPGIGVAGFCFNQNGEVLWITRNKDPHKGTLDVPAGFVDISDESLEAALEREFFEEVGIKIKNIKYLCSVKSRYQSQGANNHHMSLYFTCEAESTQISADNLEVTQPQFIDPSQVDANQIGFPNSRTALNILINQLKN